MPIYEYECPIHGRFERLVSLRLNDIAHSSVCMVEEGCLYNCEKVWSKPNLLNEGKPTIVYKDRRTGNIEMASTGVNLEQRGYERIELKTPIERSRVEKQFNNQRKEELDIRTEILNQQIASNRKARHNDLSARMNAVQHVEVDGKTESFTLDEATKGLLNKAAERSRNKPKKSTKNINETGFEVNHYDSSTIKNKE